ncbi:MAG: hypothetical protein WCW84_06750 [Sulfurimonas sp.]|jgi:hypothetical protein
MQYGKEFIEQMTIMEEENQRLVDGIQKRDTIIDLQQNQIEKLGRLCGLDFEEINKEADLDLKKEGQ